MLNESASIWDDVVAVGDGFKDGVANSEAEVNLIDKKTNSLKQLNQFGEKMSAAKKLRMKEFPEVMLNDIDTVRMTAPAITPNN